MVSSSENTLQYITNISKTYQIYNKIYIRGHNIYSIGDELDKTGNGNVSRQAWKACRRCSRRIGHEDSGAVQSSDNRVFAIARPAVQGREEVRW